MVIIWGLISRVFDVLNLMFHVVKGDVCMRHENQASLKAKHQIMEISFINCIVIILGIVGLRISSFLGKSETLKVKVNFYKTSHKFYKILFAL